MLRAEAVIGVKVMQQEKVLGVRGGQGRVKKLCCGETETPVEVEGGGQILGIVYMIIYVIGTIIFKYSII